MDRMEAEDFSLFGLLGRSWELDAPVADLAFDGSDGAVAFALADGSVAIARTKDSEPATKRIRVSAEDGRSSILPRTKPLPAITRLTVQDGTPAALSTYGKHGFVIGDALGALTSLTIGGERTPFSALTTAPIQMIDHAASTGAIACAGADNRVHLLKSPKAVPDVLDHETSIGALAISPDGQRLAVACEERVTLWNIEDIPKKIGDLTPCERPISLAWNHDRTKLALGQEKSGVAIWHLDDETTVTLPDYPAPVRSVSWGLNGDSLVTSGAFRIIAWPTNPLKSNDQSPSALDTGKAALVAVEAVAPHPLRPLIAAGYENGMLIIAQIGKPDELVLKAEGQGAITGVKWSDDASFVAIGSDQGLASIIELPPQIFR